MAVPCCTFMPHRYFIVLLSFVGMLISVGYRTCFALMVTHIMAVNNTNVNTTVNGEGSLFPNCTTKGTSRDREVEWSGSTAFQFYTAYFVGQFVMSIPAGALAARWSPKWLFGLSILITSVLQLLLPVATEGPLWVVYMIRAAQGIVEATSVPPMNAVISAWAPKTERARLINIAYAGVYLSPAVAMFATGATLCYVGWDSIMYIYGSLGAAWSLLWLLFVYSGPDQHPKVRDEEKQLLNKQGCAQAASTAAITSVPWGKIFTSLPVLAIWVGAFCRNFIFAVLVTEVQQYYKDVYMLSSAMIGLLSGVPHIFMVVFMVFGSCIFDQMVKKEIFSTTVVRKLAQGTGFGIQGACFLAIAFMDNHIQVCVLFCVGVAFSGFAISGYQTNPLDLGPQFAGPLTGISRTGMLGSVVSTVLAAQLPGKSHSLTDWQHIFLIAGILHLAGVLFYSIFASGNIQPWAQQPELTKTVSAPNVQQNGSVSYQNVNGQGYDVSYESLDDTARLLSASSPNGAAVIDVDAVPFHGDDDERHMGEGTLKNGSTMRSTYGTVQTPSSRG